MRAEDQTKADGATKNQSTDAEKYREGASVKRIREWIECGDRRVCSDHVGVRGRFGKTQHLQAAPLGQLEFEF